MSKPKVFVVGGDHSVERMFRERGWIATSVLKTEQDVEELSLVCFTGGSDIEPKLYGEAAIPKTYTAPYRDEYELKVYETLKTYDLPMVGICRGGQLLNVLSGGKMWQDVDGHGGSHVALDLATNRELWVTSTHHQMMRPGADAELLCTARKSTYRQSASYYDKSEEFTDIEAVYYPTTKSLCFQGHPEYGLKECTQYFFDLIADKHKLRG